MMQSDVVIMLTDAEFQLLMIYVCLFQWHHVLKTHSVAF